MTAKTWMLGGAAAVICLALTEAALRLTGLFSGYFVLVPGTDWTIEEAPGTVRGVTGGSRFRINPFGIRGRVFGADESEYRILAVGGSTTECAVLDDTEVWTSLLERALDRKSDNRRVWVGNVGRSGMTSREHVLHLEYLPPQYPRIDVVVAMVGVNDMLSALRQGSDYELPPPVAESVGGPDLDRAFVRVPPARGLLAPWYRDTAVWHAARRAKQIWNRQRTFGPHAAHDLTLARLARRAARTWIGNPPELIEPLVEYRRSLAAMAERAAAQQLRLVFVTAPTRWRASVPEEESRDLWLGWVGSDWPEAKAYYTTGALALAMNAYNETLLEVCREVAVECVDAAAMIEPDQSLLYDGVHFTEAGSARLAEILFAHFAASPPFRRAIR